MTEVEFTTEDFKNLAFIKEFNKEHWKGKAADLGWRYDVEHYEKFLFPWKDADLH